LSQRSRIFPIFASRRIAHFAVFAGLAVTAEAPLSDRCKPFPERKTHAGRRRAWRDRAIPALLAAFLCGLVPGAARAFEPFVVKDIRVEGVQRTEAGTVFSYLPIKVG